MTVFKRFAGAAATVCALTFAANATPVSGIIEEGGPEGDYNGLVADHSFADFSNGTNNPLLEAVGDFIIYGSVTHQNTNANQYLDGWTMDFGTGAYKLVFDWQNVLTTPLDFHFRLVTAGGTSSFGRTDVSYQPPVDAGGGSESLDFSLYIGTLSGLWTFQLDPIAGGSPPTETMRWQLTGTDGVAPVPLPAGAVLLLGGLGGLAVLRRRKAAV